MDLVRDALVLLHLVGFAALFGGSLAVFRAPEVTRVMLVGAWTQLVTGLALAALLELGPGSLDYLQVGIKLVVTVFAVVLVAKNRKFADIPRGLLLFIAGLTLANASLSVLWP